MIGSLLVLDSEEQETKREEYRGSMVTLEEAILRYRKAEGNFKVGEGALSLQEVEARMARRVEWEARTTRRAE